MHRVLTMARGQRPGFAETLKQGWKPPERRAREAGLSPTAARAATAKGTKGAKPRKGGAKRGPGANGTAPAVGEPALLKKRDQLTRQFAELQWDLGGIAYEMASRDHYRLDVLNKQAAELQRVDAELGQIERVLKLEEGGATGTCPACSALQARGAMFCWQCGTELKAPTGTEPEPAPKPKAARSKAKPARTASKK
jgi:hypothetical protein